jgi:hypothetical protein
VRDVKQPEKMTKTLTQEAGAYSDAREIPNVMKYVYLAVDPSNELLKGVNM